MEKDIDIEKRLNRKIAKLRLSKKRNSTISRITIESLKLRNEFYKTYFKMLKQKYPEISSEITKEHISKFGKAPNRIEANRIIRHKLKIDNRIK